MAIVYDFDLSLVDENTDTVVPRELAPELCDFIREQYRAGREWNPLMDEVAGLLSERGITAAQIRSALTRIRIQPGMLESLRYAKSGGCQVHILSDANSVYIETILEYYNIIDLVDTITTNPAHFEVIKDDGAVGGMRERLHIGPQQPRDIPHGCPLCPPNLCKGQQLTNTVLKSDVDGFRLPILYVGDGGGDVCPSLRLQSGDVVLARSGYAMHKTLLDHPGMRARLVPWESGLDVESHIRAFVGELKHK